MDDNAIGPSAPRIVNRIVTIRGTAQIARTAKCCPHCGAQLQSSAGAILLGAFLLMLLIAVWAFFGAPCCRL